MCGIVVVAGVLTDQAEKVFSQLLYVDGLRGMHSTGVTFVADNKEGSVVTVKDAVSPDVLKGSHEYVNEEFYINKCMIGHNRWATQGAINADNAHPFDFPSLSGCHNGTLTNQWALPDSKKFTVDSENIFHSMQSIGLEDTYAILEGAWNLVWWDNEAHSLNFLRNRERPFSYCYSVDGKTLYSASESAMLQFILDRVGVRHKPIEETKPHHLYTFVIKEGKSIVELPPRKIEPANPKPSYYRPYQYWGEYADWHEADDKGKNRDNEYITRDCGGTVSFPEFVKKDYECSWCTRQMEFDDDMTWFDRDSPLCSTCADDSGLFELPEGRANG